MRIIMGTIAMLLATTVVFAEFTAPEKAELVKLRTARNEQGGATVSLADDFRDFGTEANRPALFTAMLAGVTSEHACHQAIRHLTGAAPSMPPSFTDLTRDGVVQRGRNYVAACETATNAFATALTSLGFVRSVSSGNRLMSVVNLETFDQSLAFTDPLPLAYPRVVGPHGDYDKSLAQLQGADLKFLNARKAAILWYGRAPLWPVEAKFGLREVLRYGSDFNGLTSRVLLMHAGVVVFPESAAIEQDRAAGSGIRSAEFFRLALEAEINSNPDGGNVNRSFSGRGMFAGANGLLAVVVASFGSLEHGYDRGLWLATQGATPAVTAEAAASRMMISGYQPGGNVAAFSDISNLQSGWSQQIADDVAHGWEFSQAFDFWVIDFFFAIPAPPCGPGTRPENGQCVPDSPGACPTGQTCQPPPAVCPVFDPALVLLNSTTAEARCVSRPNN